ncbi:MAG TPA: DEAD/DEAH box helicase, partial [Pirellulales bacterium]
QIVRGRMQTAGPIRVARLAEEMALAPSKVDAALVAIEAEGLVMRGHYSPPSATPHVEGSEDALEWCDRRLLARIHRLTLDGLRRQIAPVAPADYLRFLADYQRVSPGRRWHGPAGVREAIRHLQGFEMAAGAWERRVLPARVKDYDPAWLDQLAMSGELVWGRLRPFRPDEPERPSSSRLTRAAPLSLMLRSDLAWLLPVDRQSAPPLRSGAEQVLEALTARGALFYHDLQTATGLLPSHLDEALLELAQLGLVTADGIAPVRALSSRLRSSGRDAVRRRARAAGPTVGLLSTAGRWSLFPGIVSTMNTQERTRQWAVQLLDRWGVLFRDLLAREVAAPPWWQLVSVLRRMEAQGEVRGGRFVAGVAGEQYARNESVEHLRSLRDAAPSEDWLVVAGSDPLNLQGIVTTGARVAAKATNSLALRNGRVVATLESGDVHFFDELPLEVSADLTRRLRRTG